MIANFAFQTAHNSADNSDRKPVNLEKNGEKQGAKPGFVRKMWLQMCAQMRAQIPCANACAKSDFQNGRKAIFRRGLERRIGRHIWTGKLVRKLALYSAILFGAIFSAPLRGSDGASLDCDIEF